MIDKPCVVERLSVARGVGVTVLNDPICYSELHRFRSPACTLEGPILLSSILDGVIDTTDRRGGTDSVGNGPVVTAVGDEHAVDELRKCRSDTAGRRADAVSDLALAERLVRVRQQELVDSSLCGLETQADLGRRVVELAESVSRIGTLTSCVDCIVDRVAAQ